MEQRILKVLENTNQNKIDSDTALVQIMSIIEDGKWIKVEDSLPEYGVEVIVHGNRMLSQPQMGGNRPVKIITRRVDLTGTALEKNKRRNVDENDFAHMDSTTHWMPLPNSPINE